MISLIHKAHPPRLGKPLGLLARTGTLLHITHPNRVSPHRHRHQPGVRSFHLAPSVNAVVEATEQAIISFHSATHIPWFLTIPLVSLGVALFFRLPWNAYAHQINQIRSRCTSLLMAWNWKTSKEVQTRGIPLSKQKAVVTRIHAKNTARVYKMLGVQQWKIYINVLGLPFWVLGIESVRRLCGGPRGILGRMMLGLPKENDTAPPTQEGVEAATSSTDMTGAIAGQVSTVDPSTASAVVEHARNLPDPSITTEGCLWFPDLSVPDPYSILPLALSAMLVINMLPNTKAGMRQLVNLGPRDGSVVVPAAQQRQLRLRRALICVAALVGPLTADLPAALHLYWLTSSATHWATSKALRHFMPIQQPVGRCKDFEIAPILPRLEQQKK